MSPRFVSFFRTTVLLSAGIFYSSFILCAELIPFTMPWNDQTENITNFSETLHAPAGQFGRIAVSEDGHYVVNGERIRFFGTNIVADSCFPPQNIANDIAQRYVRMGFNSVRFHHLDNGWTDSLIDYSKGNSLDLNTDNLDRLDYFISALKSAGVYANLNLLCSRRFYASDGLGEAVEEMEWKEQAILAMFHDGARNLQKEFALKLLTHVNPYTQLSYAEDPAIAVVEINNENGIFQLWHDGGIDRLPSHFNSALATKWNEWLQERYFSTQELYQAWKSLNEPLGSNLLVNGSLTSTGHWRLETHGVANASFKVANEFNGETAAVIEVLKVGEQNWHVQFNQADLVLEEGQVYTLSYWIKGDTARNVRVSLMQAHAPYRSLEYSKNIVLTNEWKQYTSTFIAKNSDPNVRFNLGSLGSSLGTVYLADVSFQKGGSIGVLAEGITLESGNIPTFTKDIPGTSAAMEDWFRFLRDVETEYWLDMQRFVTAIGYQGIQWGTTIMNSPPSAQKGFDAIDSHSYWNHPHFPGASWSETDWYVENTPMVNETDGGVIGSLSWQRVRGKPHNVTEYQHSGPNTYSSDAGLFAAIYGSIQDWDGIYIFHYGAGSEEWDREIFNGFFDIDQHPAKLVNASIASYIFRNFEIPMAEREFVVPFGGETELNVLATKGTSWQVGDARHLELGGHLPLTHRVSMDLDLELASTDFIIPLAPENKVFETDNGMVKWDVSMLGNGVLTVRSKRVKSVIGFDANRTFDLGGVVIDPGETEQNWSTVTVVMKDGDGFDALGQGGAGIIVATGNFENTNMVWTDESKTSVGNQWGEAPTLVENVNAIVTFGVSSSRVRVWALDVHGNRRAELRVAASGGNNCYFELGGDTGSLWYEFLITKE